MFKNLIPVHRLENEDYLERGPGQQGLLPDFWLEIPSPAGKPSQGLAELKIIGAVPNGIHEMMVWPGGKRQWRGETHNYDMSTGGIHYTTWIPSTMEHNLTRWDQW